MLQNLTFSCKTFTDLSCHQCQLGGTIRIPGGAWSFLEINISVGKMGEINKWPQGMVEIQPILR